MMTDFVTKILTKLFFRKVGVDLFGNEYFIANKKNGQGSYSRRVLYKGSTEPSKVPPLWNAWLRYNLDELPNDKLAYSWQKEHLPNLTGTEYAHQPKGVVAMLDNGQTKLDKYSGQYRPWRPGLN